MSEKGVRIARILFVSIFIVIILAIVLIFCVWKNFASNRSSYGEEISSESLDVGNFYYKSYEDNYYLEKYLSKINKYFLNSDIDHLYELLSDDYKEYYSYDKEKLYSNLKGKNVFGKQFNSVEYSAVNIEGKKVYKVKLNSNDLTTTIDINILEESPNRFEISLDNFIMKIDATQEQIINGITLNIKEVIYFNDRILTNATLENANNYNVLVNYQSLNESIYYRIVSGTSYIDYLTEATVFNGECKILLPNSDIELKFDLRTDFTTFGAIRSLVIKDVKLGENSPAIELEYNF